MQESPLDTFILQLGIPGAVPFEGLLPLLPKRVQRALRMLKVKDTEQLLEVDCHRVADNGIRPFTAEAIEALQQEVRQSVEAAARATKLGKAAIRLPWSRPFRESPAMCLPLFGGGFARSGDLHRSYFGAVGLDELDLPYRAVRALRDTAIGTIGQLLCTSCHQLLNCRKSFGAGSLATVQQAVLSFLKQRNGVVAAESPLDMNCFEDMVEDVLRRCISKPAMYETIRRRIGVGLGAPQTLEEIGRDDGVSRERIRQREQNAVARLGNPDSRRRLVPFLSAVRRSLDECGEDIAGEELTRAVATALRWPTVPPATVFRAFLAACAGRCGWKTGSRQFSNAAIVKSLFPRTRSLGIARKV